MMMRLSSFSVGHSSLFPMEDDRGGFGEEDRGDGVGGLGSPHGFPHQNGERIERYSRKVFVGGLPPDIDEGMERIGLELDYGSDYIK